MWQDIEHNPTWRGMQRVRQLSKMVICGKKPLQMFCSIAGLGKTETVLEEMVAGGQEPHYASPTSAEGFCQDLWLHRESTYFLDDCDRLARSEPCANIAKMCWGPQRLVVVPLSLRIQKNEERRLADSEHYNPNVPPPTFKVGAKHGCIWNSNKNFSDPQTVANDMQADFRALVSRGLDPYWIPSDPQSTYDYTIWMIINGMLRRHRQGSRGEGGGFKLLHQQEVLDFFCQYGDRLREVTPRMAWKLASARRDDPDYQTAWRDQLADDAVVRITRPDKVPQLMSPAMRRAAPPPIDPPPINPEVMQTLLRDFDHPEVTPIKSAKQRKHDELVAKLDAKNRSIWETAP